MPCRTASAICAKRAWHRLLHGITKCCTKVCPEEIKITDNAIIPLKERVVDEYYDPLRRLFKMFK